MSIASVNRRTGETVGEVFSETGPDDLDAILQAAADASCYLDWLGRTGRARLLLAIADELDASANSILPNADRETALSMDRLASELLRSTYQMRFFAEVVTEGGYLEATIDRPKVLPTGISPDIRRMLVPLGPVAVFGASNFPLAFSTVGGDTTSALAAGCPVVVKVHENHPATAVSCLKAIWRALRQFGAPEAVVGAVFGRAPGLDLVKHPAVRAVGFTGSLAGGRTLLEAVNSRSDPIPFYGELSSLNPVVVTRRAAESKGTAIGDGLAKSVLGSSGQFCTKPGLCLVPSGAGGDAVVQELTSALERSGHHVLLSDTITNAYIEGVDRMRSTAADVRRFGRDSGSDSRTVLATIALTQASTFRTDMAQECFGPTTVVVRYDDYRDVNRVMSQLPASLTGTIHSAGADDADDRDTLVELFRDHCGRLVFDGFPTGVSVSWGQHHGGPWPSTNSIHSSVGSTAIRRFLRPLAWQNAPEHVLPHELRDDCDEIPRRIDGRLVLPPRYARDDSVSR